MAKLHCTVVTPESTALEREADFLVVPLFDGELGIAPGHSPLIGRLGFGELRLKSEGKQDRYYVDGGFVQVADNRITVLTSRAVPAVDLQPGAARELLAEALAKKANTEQLLEIRDRQIAQARAQIRLAERAEW